MSIPDGEEKGKRWGISRVVLTILLLAVGTGSYAVGRLWNTEHAKPEKYAGSMNSYSKPVVLPGPVENVEKAATSTESSEKEPPVPIPAKVYVASRGGKTYYLPVCPTVKRIKDENKVWFSSKKEAESAGYLPSQTCKLMASK